jgi:hypothetical protein
LDAADFGEVVGVSASPLGVHAHLRPQLPVGMLVEKARDDLID